MNNIIAAFHKLIAIVEQHVQHLPDGFIAYRQAHKTVFFNNGAVVGKIKIAPVAQYLQHIVQPLAFYFERDRLLRISCACAPAAQKQMAYTCP